MLNSSCGILVGCDEKQEWILPWWLRNYRLTNSLPVAFVDFGMSPAAKHWCSKQGVVLSLAEKVLYVQKREEIDPEVVKRWESVYGTDFWESRPSWFYKPIALLETPFERTLWLDVDCEVKGELASLFSTVTSEIALCPEPSYAQEKVRASSICEPGEVLYNSGAILYQKKSPLVALWADEARNCKAPFWSDQHLLSRIIFEKNHPVKELSPLYNWHMALGENQEAKIIHWLGERGKMYIRLNFNKQFDQLAETGL